jgi:hypothetical protein
MPLPLVAVYEELKRQLDRNPHIIHAEILRRKGRDAAYKPGCPFRHFQFPNPENLVSAEGIEPST